VLAKQPEVMILSAMGGEGQRLKDPWVPFRGIPAVATQRIYIMDSGAFHRPGPRIVEGIEQLARWLHPQAFHEKGVAVSR
jgi:iron complex transport system substrate-binding protein